MDARVSVVLLDYQIDTPRRYTYIRWGGEFQRARYLNMMKKSEPFINVMKAILNKLRDREMICMAERIKLIEELYKIMPSNSKAMFCGSGGLETLEAQHTFATPGKCRDGVDAPQKDCVITTSPISNIEQLTGRVLRPMEGKRQPIVIDMVDYGCRDMSRSLYNRVKFYDQKGWSIQFLLVTQTKMVKIDQERAYEIINGVF